jgi:hypothetical protein
MSPDQLLVAKLSLAYSGENYIMGECIMYYFEEAKFFACSL